MAELLALLLLRFKFNALKSCGFFFFTTLDASYGISTLLGFTEILIGVGCVLKVGICKSSNVRESGDNNPFPMHIKRKSSPSLQLGTSTEFHCGVFFFGITEKWGEREISVSQRVHYEACNIPVH
jgi:hypothetical protein